MKKAMKTVLIILISVLVAAAVIFMLRGTRGRNHSPITRYRSSYGGDMNGSTHKVEIIKADDERAWLMTSDADWHYQDPIVCEYYVPVSVLSDIEKVFDDCGMYSYDDLREQKYHAYDAGSTDYIFAYEDGGFVGFSSRDEIPSKGRDGLREISAILKAAAGSAEKMPALVIDQSSWKSGPSAPEDIIELQVYGYCDKELRFRLVNGTQTDAQIQGTPVLYRLEGQDRAEIFTSEEEFVYYVYREYTDDHSIKLKERLDAGSYLLVIGDYETEFEIR